jgi:hypothetical protein
MFRLRESKILGKALRGLLAGDSFPVVTDCLSPNYRSFENLSKSDELLKNSPAYGEVQRLCQYPLSRASSKLLEK